MFCIEFIIVDGEVLYVLRTADGRIIKSSFDLEIIKGEVSSMASNWLQASKDHSQSQSVKS